jgi:ParB/RepB/Spo0J family partition protein
MATKRRKPEGPGFGEVGGSNVTEYLGRAERTQELERQLEAGERLIDVPVDLIDRSPYQARVQFDPEELDALAEDIRTNGLNNPITVRSKLDGRYELVAGERRWLASQRAGLTHVTARERPLDDFDAHLIGVSENNQRADFSPWEKAIEAAELLQHAKASGRPYTQRDLARYLNRNVAIVNQQLAIAGAVTLDLLARANVNAGDVCQLPHETLHRIAKLSATQRPRALKEAIRTQQARRSTSTGDSASAAAPEPSSADRWTRLWERGGFQVHVRKPLKDLDPGRAEKYIQDLLPGIGGLAARAAEGEDGSGVARWDHEQGRLLFLRPAERMSKGERQAAREALEDLLESLEASH